MSEKKHEEGCVAQNTTIQILTITTIFGFVGVIGLIFVIACELNSIYSKILNGLLAISIIISTLELGVILWQRRQSPYITTSILTPLEKDRTSEELLKILIEDNRKNSADNKAYFLFQLINPIIALGAMVLAIYSSNSPDNIPWMFATLILVVMAEIFVIVLSVTSGKQK